MRYTTIVIISILEVGCQGGRSTDYWLQQLQDADVARRREAVRELAGREADRVVPALAGALRDENHYVRHDAAIALGRFGPAATPAMPALIVASKDKEKSVRAAALATLKKINPARS